MIEFANGRDLFEKQGSWFWMDLGNFQTKEVKGVTVPVLKDGKPVPMGPEKIANGMDNLKIYLQSAPQVIELLQKRVTELIKKEETQPVGAPSV